MQKQRQKLPPNMINHHHLTSLLCLLLQLAAATSAAPPLPTPTVHHPPNPAPAPTPPPSVVMILQKAKGLSRFLALMTQTQIDDRLETELSSKNKGLTVFAPNNDAFKGLKSGTLNALSPDQLAKLVLFHCVQSFISPSDFEVVTNPLNTEAGSADNNQFALNVTALGSQVNFSTGVGRDHASVVRTIYLNAKKQLVVYEINKLLLPKAIFPNPPFVDTPATAPGPALAGPNGKKKNDGGSDGGDSAADEISVESSGGSLASDVFHAYRGGGAVALLVAGLLIVLGS